MEELDYGREVLRLEAAAVAALIDRLDGNFKTAVKLISDCPGHVVTTGMGKSGIIAQKISATLASTGTPSFYLHPAEASHGDLGRVVAGDVVVAISNSGGSEEIRRLIPGIKRIGAKLVAMTGSAESSLARHADCHLCTGEAPEACPVGLAPTTSTTAQLALGDALAMTVAKKRAFSREEYALYHPGGALGRSLLRVHELMADKEHAPPAQAGTITHDALVDAGGLGRKVGALAVVDKDGVLRGLLTDGDIRRWVLRDANSLKRPLDELMTADPLSVRDDQLAAEAWRAMREHSFDDLPVVDADGRYVGILDVLDLLKAGFVEQS
ncbi:MAG: KpsF/GutQ family sugar-phosphate isomerase [Planctomycetota bacterium]|nr:KpsF/GutQ family sugar-phosphate isomerase [Planctomycetota bacterium]